MRIAYAGLSLGLALVASTGACHRRPKAAPAESLSLGSASCSVLVDHGAACWGGNTWGVLGYDPEDRCPSTSAKHPIPFVAETIPCNVRAHRIPDIEGVVQIATHGSCTCARLADGTVRCWGQYCGAARGETGFGEDRVPSTSILGVSGVTDIAVGLFHQCVVRSEGKVACIGRNQEGQLGTADRLDRRAYTDVAGLSGVTSLSAAGEFTCALRSPEGSVWCWGRNLEGSLGFPPADPRCKCSPRPERVPGITGAVQIAAYSFVTTSRVCAVLRDGSLWCWGRDADGPTEPPAAVGGVSDAVEVGVGFDVYVRRRDGSVVRFARGVPPATTKGAPPTVVPGLRATRHVAVADGRACVIEDTGSIQCWGDNISGELGVGDKAARTSPSPVLW